MDNKQKDGIYNAKELGAPKTVILGLQHMFAMFGSTVLVPILTGLSVSTTLLFAGLGTLIFHFITKRKVPAFLGSSFAFLGGYMAIAPLLNRINPAALISDALYSLVVYPSYTRFFTNIAGLLLLSALFCLGGLALVRRKKYASL